MSDLEETNRIMDALIRSIIRTTDEKILQEVEKKFGDRKYLANKGREILKRVNEKLKRKAE